MESLSREKSDPSIAKESIQSFLRKRNKLIFSLFQEKNYLILKELCIFCLFILSCVFIFSSSAFCLPEAQDVEYGKAIFNKPDDNCLEITASDKAVINFRSFNIAANERVSFIQPSVSSAVLSRVVGNTPSQILGSLTANGILFFTNPSGIKFSPTSQVKVNSFIASTLEISTNNFINGNYIFERNGQPAYILNEGLLQGNNIALISSAIANSGLIQATAGKVELASGDKTTLIIDELGLMQIAINEKTSAQVFDENGNSLKDAIANSGNIEARQVYMSAQVAQDIFENAINNQGTIKSSSLVEKDGKILLVTNDDITLSGTLEANSIEVQSDKDIKVNSDLKVTSKSLSLFADYNYDGIGSFRQLQGTIQNSYGDILIDASKLIILNQLIAEAGSVDIGSRRAPDLITCLGAITANKVQITSKQFGSQELPLNIKANQIHLTRSLGDIDILDSIGIGTSILLRGPPDGFGAIIYNTQTNLTLQALNGSISISSATQLRANNLSLLALGYVTNHGLLQFNILIEKSYHFTTTGSLIGKAAYIDDVDGAADYGGSIGTPIDETGDINVISNITLTADGLVFTAGNDGSGSFISNGYSINSDAATNYSLTINVANDSTLGAIGNTQQLTNLTLGRSAGAGTPIFTLGSTITLAGDLTINASAQLETLGRSITIAGDLSIAGTLTGGGNVTINGGSVTGDGLIDMSDGGIFLLDGTGSFGGVTDWTFYNLIFGDGVDAAITAKAGANKITCLDQLKISLNQTLQAGSGTWNLSWGTGILQDIKMISVGSSHTLALTSSGVVFAWGDNYWGKLGDGTTINRSAPVLVLKGEQSESTTYLGDAGGASAIISIVAAGVHSLALTSAGTVFAWGYNDYGQLGDNTITNRLTPVRVLKGAQSESTTYLGDAGGASAIIMIATGNSGGSTFSHSLALTSSGRVFAWGYNGTGRLGDNTTTQRNTPIQVLKGAQSESTTYLGDAGGASAIIMIAGGGYHSLALTSSGRVFAWGYNYNGQLGDNTATNRYTPVYVLKGAQSESTTYLGDAGGASAIIMIAGGNYHSLALTSAGRVFAWGYNGYGQLGDNTTTTRRTPVKVLKGAQSESTTYLGDAGGASAIIAIATGQGQSSYALALTSAGKVFAWGNNNYGPLGDNTTTQRNTPIRVLKGAQSESTTYLGDAGGASAIIGIAAGNQYSLALTSSGRVFAWGYNGSGQLGNNTTTDSYTPIKTIVLPNSGSTLSLLNIKMITAGNSYSLALTNEGTVLTWGAAFSSTSTPRPVLKGEQSESTTYLGDAGGDSAIISIAAGATHQLFLTKAGIVFALGTNQTSQLGNGTGSASTTPVHVLKGAQSESTTYLGDAGGDSAIISISAGGDWIGVQAGHSLALTKGGRVFAWGHNGKGALGDGTITRRSTPVQVLKGEQSESTTYFGDAGGDSAIISISAGNAQQFGGAHNLALTKGGRVFAWGYNSSGRLGDGTTTDRWTPVQVLKGAQSESITYLGDAGGGSAIIAIAAGYAHSLALTSSGRVFAWGYNNYGQLGDDTTTNSYTPIQVLKGAQSESTTYLGDAGGPSAIVSVATGGNNGSYSFSLAVTSAGTVFTWGLNTYGQLGDGTTTERHTPVQVLKGAQSESTTYLGDAGGGSAIIMLAAGNSHSLALTSAGKVFAWGSNYTGQLGDNTKTDRYTPVLASIVAINSLNLQGTLTAQTSTFIYSGDFPGGDLLTSVNIVPGNYWNLLIDNSAESYTLTGAVTIENDLNITNGVLDVGDNNALNVIGNFNNNGTFLAQQGTVTLNGSVDQTVTNGDFYNLVINNTGLAGSDNIIVDGLLDVGGDLTITNGDLDVNTNDPNVEVGGDLLVGASGSIDLGSGVWTFNGDTLQTINPNGQSFNDVVFANTASGADINYSGPLTINGNLVVDEDTSISQTDNSDISISGTVNSNSDAASALTMNSGSGDITISGTTGGSYTLASLTLAGNDITLADIGDADTIGVTGATTVTADATGSITLTGSTYKTAGSQSYNAGGPARPITLNAPATFTTTDSSLDFTGTVDSQAGENNALILNAGSATVTFNNDVGSTQPLGPITKQGTGNLVFGLINLACMGLTLSAGTINNDGTDSGTWTVDGDVTISSGTLKATSNNFTITGDWDSSSAFQGGTGTVIFNGSQDQLITSTAAAAFNNLTLNNTGLAGNDDIIVSGTLNVDGLFRLTNGNLDLATNNANVETAGDVIVEAAGTIAKGTGTWTFDGSGTSTLTNNGQNLGAVTLNGTAKILQLADALTLDSLTIGADNTFDLNGQAFDFTSSQAVANNGIFQLQGTEAIGANVVSFGITAGTTRYIGDADTVDADIITLLDFGATDYYNLELVSTDANDVFRTNAAGSIVIAGDFTITNGSFDNGTNNNDITIGGDVNARTLDAWNMGSGSISLAGALAGYQYIDFAGKTLRDLVINNPGSTKRFTSGLTASSFNAIAGTIDFYGQTFNILGDCNIATTAQTIGSGSGLNGSTINVGGNLDWQGEPNDLLDLEATIGWFLNVSGRATVRYASVALSDASGGSNINGRDHCWDMGNNSNWDLLVWQEEIISFLLMEAFKTDTESSSFLNFIDEAYADQPDMIDFIDFQAGSNAQGQDQQNASQNVYGFDEAGLLGSQGRYSKPYLPGDYQTIVVALQGEYTVASYDESGPIWDKAASLVAVNTITEQATIGQQQEASIGSPLEDALYGFDEKQISVSANIYSKPYLPGDYQTTVEVTEGKVAVSDYNEAGPQWTKGSLLKPGDKATAKKEFTRSQKATNKMMVKIIVPETAEGEFMVVPYDKAGLHFNKRVILKPGDDYSELRELK